MNEYIDGVIRRSVQRNAEKIGSSDLFVSVLTPAYLDDPYCAMQLGLAILMNKPIRLLVKEGTDIPPGLLKVADKVKYYRGPDDIGLGMDFLLKD